MHSCIVPTLSLPEPVLCDFSHRFTRSKLCLHGTWCERFFGSHLMSVAANVFKKASDAATASRKKPNTARREAVSRYTVSVSKTMPTSPAAFASRNSAAQHAHACQHPCTYLQEIMHLYGYCHAITCCNRV
jgi:hypothetical protein